MTRHWKAKEVFQSEAFNRAAAFVACEMTNASIPYCLVGGLAVGYYHNPPVTPDSDFLLKVDIDELEDLVYEYRGWQSRPLWFPKPKSKGLPKRGFKLSRNTPFNAEVDLICTGGDAFLEKVVENSVPCRISKSLILPVTTAEDLVVMKSLVGRDKDQEDVQALYEVRADLDRKYIDRWMKKLTAD